MAATPPETAHARADVELRLPADGAYVSVLRTTTAALAARLDFTIDDIEDLRIAVGEASAMVLPQADIASDLHCRFFLRPGELTVSVGVDVTSPVRPDFDSFAWQVLTTLASGASIDADEAHFFVVLTMRPSTEAPGPAPSADVAG